MALAGELGAFSYDNPLYGLARTLEEELNAVATLARTRWTASSRG